MQVEGTFGELSNTLLWWGGRIAIPPTKEGRGGFLETPELRTLDGRHRHSDGAVAVSRMDDQTLVGWWISQVVSDYFSDISTLLVKSLLWTECTLKSHPPL